MKKHFSLLFATVLVALFSSCSKEESNNPTSGEGPELKLMTFTAEECGLRTTLNSDKTISWGKDDAISIFDDKGNNFKFTVDAEKKGIFTGEAAVSDNYYAVYPYQETAKFDKSKSKITYNVTYKSNWCATETYPKQKAILAAKVEGDKINFKQVCAYLKLTVPDDVKDLKEIYVFSAGDTQISGTFDLSFPEGTPVMTLPYKNSEDKQNQTGITYEGGPFKPGNYYIPILPDTLSTGFNLKLIFDEKKEDGKNFVARAHTGKKITPHAGKIINLGTVKKTQVFEYANFEDGILPSVRLSTGNAGVYSKKALGVIENPHETEVNSSKYVLDNNMSNISNSTLTSGMFTISVPSTEFSDAVKNKYNAIRMKVWLGANDYYPRLYIIYKDGTEKITTSKKLPSSVNGTSITDEASFKDAVNENKGEWITLEWNTSVWGIKNFNNFNNLVEAVIRPFENENGEQTGKDDAHTRSILIDDIQFISFE